jgi:hypothetical protein
MDDEVRGGDWFELVETKGEASSMEEVVESHRGGATPVGWQVRMVTTVFPRRQCAPVVGGGSGRHLQHRRGKGEVRGKTIWPEMDQRWCSPKRGGCDGDDSKSVAPSGGFRWRGGQNGKVGCESGGGGSIQGLLAWTRGAKLRCARRLPYAKTEGKWGVWSKVPGGRMRERGGGENLAVWAPRVEEEGPGG